MSGPYQDYAVMVLCAADADQIWHLSTQDGRAEGANPTLPAQASINVLNIAYVHDDNFTLLRQLRCDDQFLLKQDNVYYGLVLRALEPVGPMKPGDLLVAIRGTMDALEWLNDAAALVMSPEKPTFGDVPIKGELADGFWDIYATMRICNDGGDEGVGLVEGLLAMAGGLPEATIFVAGHSLGAALATYLNYELSTALGPSAIDRVSTYLFASPQTGTSDWVASNQQPNIGCDLANYQWDVVPELPPDGSILVAGGPTHNVHLIPGGSPGALDTGPFARIDAVANHSPVGYALMLDPSNLVAQRLRGVAAAEVKRVAASHPATAAPTSGVTS